MVVNKFNNNYNDFITIRHPAAIVIGLAATDTGGCRADTPSSLLTCKRPIELKALGHILNVGYRRMDPA